ncbi:hypothetical protein GCM10022631_34790 [Deinococcus rubellus]
MARQRLLFLWTAALCLVASFAYLTREPQNGLQNLNGALGLPALSGMAGMDMDSKDRSGETPAYSPHSHHAAHCPFCFSAAFALEAQDFVLSLVEAIRPGFLRVPYPQPHLLALRHAEVRAPPPSRAEA